MDAWNTLKRARDLLTVAYCYADKGVEEGACRDLAEKFATLIDLIEDEVDNAMMMIPHRHCDLSEAKILAASAALGKDIPMKRISIAALAAAFGGPVYP